MQSKYQMFCTEKDTFIVMLCFQGFRHIHLYKKVQQCWQTSMLAIHLPLACLVSMPVIFCPIPSSSIVILVFYLFSTEHVWELWVWIQFTGLTLPLRVTPTNNPITIISLVWHWYSHWATFLLPLTVYAQICKFRNSFPRKPECQSNGWRARTRL